MRLNPDCIRDILMEIEENTSFGTFYEYPSKKSDNDSRLAKYDRNTVLYHIKQCELSGYLTDVHWYMEPSCLVVDLSPTAHQFLADIREDTNWNKTKDIAKSVGSNSLDALKQIASGVIATLIQTALLKP